MNRQEFLSGLAHLLADIPEAERLEALEYYNSYFDDAGPENEAAVIQELGGTPDKAAASIKADLSGKTGRQNYGEYTEKGYRDTRIPNTGQMPQPVPQPKKESRRKSQKDNSRIIKIILVSLILLATSGIWTGLLGGLISLIFGLVGVVFSLLIGLAGMVFSILVGAVSLIFAGIVKCAANPALGLLSCGFGMLLLSLGILLLIAFIFLAKKFLPKFLRWAFGCFCRFFRSCKTTWDSIKSYWKGNDYE